MPTVNPISETRDGAATCAVLTVSDSLTETTDREGTRVHQALRDHGHRIADYRIVTSEPEEISLALDLWLTNDDIQVICCIGGTDLTPLDGAVEVVERFLDRKLEGFGELFRMLAYQDAGSSAMLLRATAGVAGDTFIFVIPDAPGAVQRAMDKLILPELARMNWER